MIHYRYNIYTHTDNHWRFLAAYMTEEAADKKAYISSLNNRIKMVEYYEDDDGDEHPFRIFYFINGKYSHKVYREIYKY